MPLTISEREATKIIFREKRRRGNDKGLQYFARAVLGAHQEQAKRLATIAADILSEGDIAEIEFPEDEQKYAVSRDGYSASYEGPIIQDAEQLMELLGFNPDHYYVKKGGGSAWGKVGDQKLSIRADFELKEYDFFKDVDRDTFIREMSEHAPQYPTDWKMDDERPEKELRLLEIVVADLHADQLAAGYNLDIARQRFVEAIKSIAQNASVAGFSQTVLVLNGDTFNWDFDNKTTAGTPQESDLSPHVFSTVRQMVVEAVDGLRAFAPVRLIVTRGNHDYEKASYLADSLYSWYSKDELTDVVLIPRDREYIRWGVNLIGVTHGAEEKKADLPMIMMRENDVSGVEVFEWHLGHLHTARSEENQGVLLRWFRTPATTSRWGVKKGFGHNLKEIVGLVWHKEDGKVAEFPVQFL